MSSQSTETPPLNRELVLLVMQFLGEHGFTETVHKLEQESSFYFNMMYLEEEVINGSLDEVERYLSGFTKIDDNAVSRKMFFEIRKQKYLEVLDTHDCTKATEILTKDLKVFASTNENVFKELTELLTLENFRENNKLAYYKDSMSVRTVLLAELKRLIGLNPLLYDKLQFPTMMNSRLQTLVNQSLHMQHKKCENPMPFPEIKTLFEDHNCEQPIGTQNGDGNGTVDTIPEIADKSEEENNHSQ